MAEIPTTASVAVVGAGLMGHAIASVFAASGSAVRIWDAVAATRDTVLDRIRGLGAVDGDDLHRIQVEATLDATVEGVDLVVEAIAEDLLAKQALMSELDSLIPDAIIATNTSVLRITDIARGSARPDRIVGAHWWNPPHLIPIVEVIRGDHTSDRAVERMHEWLMAAGKTPVDVLMDAPGFIGNRMQFALWREAMAIVEQGICDAETVDLVARETFGRRLRVLGPIENADLIGLPLTSAIMEYVLPHLSTTDSPSRLIAEAIAAGRLGGVAGGGLLDWPDGALEQTRQRLADHLRSLA